MNWNDDRLILIIKCMLDIKRIIKNKYFEEVILKKWEVLFDEWDIDNNLYIIKSGNLSIWKYTTTDKIDIKQLAVLEIWAIFWEWSLKKSEAKQVKISALSETELFKINAQEWIQSFIKEYPKEGIELLTEIIDISNKRLLESNFLVTSSYQMSKVISEINLYDNKNLFMIIDNFDKVIWAEYILYLERNPVVENYMTVKYDTRLKWKMQNNLVDIWDGKLDLHDLVKDWIKVEKFNYIEKLKNKNQIIWYLVIWESSTKFTEGQKKAISSISTLIAWVIKQKQAYEDERNKEMNAI